MRRDLKTIIQRGLLLLAFFCGISVASPVEAYSSIRKESMLLVEDQVFVDDGEVKLDYLSDGKGGYIKYDEPSNTLTINNYTFTKLGLNRNFITVYAMSEYKSFRIILNGTSTMIRSETKRKSNGNVEYLSIDINGSAIIEGNGKLVANTGIVAGRTLVIKDCDLVIEGVYHAIEGDYVTIQNANLTLSTESLPAEERRFHASALHVGNFGYDGFLTIENSVVKAKTGGSNWQSVMIRDNRVVTKNIDKKIVLSSDMEIKDENGKTLNVCFYECWDAMYFVFSKEEPQKTLLNSSSKISQSVYFISSNKQHQVNAIDEVVNAINAIGTVTLDSGAKIKAARDVYNKLGQDEDNVTNAVNEDYMKAKVFNYKDLETAESTYVLLQKQETQRLAQEAQEKRKKEQEKLEASGNGQPKETYTEIVNGVKHTIKTPKLKSVKSKKKKMITLTWTTNKNSSGYQISYSTSKKFKKSKTKTVLVKNKKTKTKTIKKLKSKKTYYVRIRGYKTINGKKHYGHWSQVKKVKTK